MIIVGEKLNASRKRIAQAIEARDADAIARVALAQAKAGADFIDVNAGTFVDAEAAHLGWLVQTVQAAVDLPLCLDSPDPDALAQAKEVHRGEPMVNSISLERERFEKLLPVVTGGPCHVVALCMAKTSMPTTVEERVEVGTELTTKLMEAGIPPERIYIDPLVQPVSVDVRMGAATLGAIRALRGRFPAVHAICGLSNVSFGLPARKLVNRTFLAQAIACGLDAAILDPTDPALMATLKAADMLAGRDEYCERFIDAHGDGRLDPSA
jgi:5-methyltetrahydrofolate--homocysteine methyltransferase